MALTRELKLTVVIRNDSPMINVGDGPSYRSVHIDLTADQCRQLELQHTHTVGGNKFYEEFSKCFIEPPPTASSAKDGV